MKNFSIPLPCVLLFCLLIVSNAELSPVVDDFPENQELVNGLNTLFYIGDFNGDGISDIIRQEKEDLATSQKGVSYLLLFDQNGEYTQHLLPEKFGLTFDMTNLDIGDFNGDGKDDILKHSKGSTTLLLAIDNDPDFFKMVEFATNFGTHQSEGYLYIGDFNGDGRADVIRTGDQVDETLFLLLSNGEESFDRFNLTRGFLPDIMFIGDFNGDGKDDILGVDGDLLMLLLSGGNGSFEFITLNIELGLGDGDNMIIDDFNGDGRADIYTRIKRAGEIDLYLPSEQYLYFSTGNNFDKQEAFVIEDETELFTGDFNGDKKADILSFDHFSDNPLTIYFSNGNGNFEEKTIF